MLHRLFVIMLVILVTACGGQSVKVVGHDGNDLGEMKSGEGGMLFALSEEVQVQGTVNCQILVDGYTVTLVSLVPGDQHFVSLTPGWYDIICQATDINGVEAMSVSGAMVEIGEVADVNIILYFKRPTETGINISVETVTATTWYITKNAASPSGIKVGAEDLEVLRINLTHDSGNTECISHLGVSINKSAGVSVAECVFYDTNGELSANVTTSHFDAYYTHSSSNANPLVCVDSGITKVLQVRCATYADPSATLQAHLTSFGAQPVAFVDEMPSGNPISF